MTRPVTQLTQHTDKTTHDSEAPKTIIIHFLNIITLWGNYTAYDNYISFPVVQSEFIIIDLDLYDLSSPKVTAEVFLLDPLLP